MADLGMVMVSVRVASAGLVGEPSTNRKTDERTTRLNP